ncbi:hypothetical protein P154DRAFT_556702 [Amniculicola lignicola CBS 123094]|uniref:Malate dehydrogenase n=1 Tax=Amniculicola lignicola CBS 123094 TaxID=1392246 RepID=A0A6A5W1N6_9PLEO|nr:hypothetical protein P154DRAFT_556702 [Amniculicola lignicola CBS 123094]
MLFSNTITLIMALAPATLFAAPTPTKVFDSIAEVIARRHLSGAQIQSIENGNCDLSRASMPIAPTPLPVVSAGLTLRHVAVGRGTQNYTCTAGAPAPVAVGAVATLYNATCAAVRAPAVLASVTKLALDHPIPDSELAAHMLSGHHIFIGAPAAPFFDLNAGLNGYGSVTGAKAGNSTAPATASKGTNNLGSVPWLKLKGTAGDYKEIYRINTAGGVAPKTCDGIVGTFEVDYAAEYWFFA